MICIRGSFEESKYLPTNWVTCSSKYVDAKVRQKRNRNLIALGHVWVVLMHLDIIEIKMGPSNISGWWVFLTRKNTTTPMGFPQLFDLLTS
jgi:hypothetical protein